MGASPLIGWNWDFKISELARRCEGYTAHQNQSFRWLSSADSFNENQLVAPSLSDDGADSQGSCAGHQFKTDCAET